MPTPKAGPYKYVQVGAPPEKNSDATIKSQDKAGGSNAGTYKNKRFYAGPAGGAPKYSFPIDTYKDGEDALRLRGKAPKPEGIMRAVFERWPQLKEKYEKKATKRVPAVKRKSKEKK